MPENLSKAAQLEGLRLMRSLSEQGDTKHAAAVFDAHCKLYGVTPDAATRDALDAWLEASNVLRRRIATFASMSLHQLRNL